MKPRPAQRPGRVFAVPAAIAAATLIGLVAGVVGDGAADILSWTALGVGPAAIAWALARAAD